MVIRISGVVVCIATLLAFRVDGAIGEDSSGSRPAEGNPSLSIPSSIAGAWQLC